MKIFKLQNLSLLFLLGLILISCSKENILNENVSKSNDTEYNFSSNKQKRLTTKEMEFVGIEHNNMLDFVYTNLSTNNITQTNAQKYIKQILVDTINNSNYTRQCKDLAAELIKEKLIYNNEQETLYTQNEANYLSEREKKYLDDLLNLMRAEEKTISELIISIEALESEIAANQVLDNNELFVLYSSTNTAKYSLTYWKNDTNITKWSTYLKDNSEISKKLGPGENIATADVAGAVGGAIGALAVNVIPGAGQVAYGGAIIGGAVSASAAAGVYELAHWLFD